MTPSDYKSERQRRGTLKQVFMNPQEPTHETNSDLGLTQYNVSTCPECGLEIVKQIQVYFGKRHVQTLPSLPRFQAHELCDGECAV